VVYADLVGALPPTSPADAFEPLLIGGKGGWMEIWLAQIARSFVAALLTMPPELRELDVVETRLSHLRSERPSWGFFERGRKTAELAALEQRRNGLRQRIADDGAGRFRLARFIGPDREGSCVQRHLVNLRLLDMLVRHLVTEWMPRLIREWTPYAGDEVARADAILLGDSGTSFQAFDSALFKLGVREVGSILGPQRGAELREDLFAFLNPRDLNEHEFLSVARDCGLPETAVRRLIERFRSQSCAVRLPFRYPNESAAPPQSLLARWVPGLHAALPESDADNPLSANRLI
jgi:hypothetical protein